jgi:Zn-dependent peptidase ImmA (M78 family)
MDKGDFVVSFSQWNKKDLIETRANTFASRYLLPPAVLRKLPVTHWTDAEILTWATKLKVSTAALAIGLTETGIIGDQECDKLMKVRVGRELKSDPELEGLTSNSLQRKKTLLERGLSSSYVWLCFEAISEGAITNAKAAEMLLVDDGELSELAEMFRVKTAVHD